MKNFESQYAIVLKKSIHKDSDKIVTFLTPDYGKIIAFGKHAKKSIKRNLNLLDYGYLLKIAFEKSNITEYLFLRKVSLIKIICDVQNDLIKYYILSLVNELLDSLLYGMEKSSDIFNLTLEFFEKLNKNLSNKDNYNALLIYCFRLLFLLGYGLKFDICGICGKKVIADKFLSKRGIIICESCFTKKGIEINKNNVVVLNKGTLKIIENYNKNINFDSKISEQLKIILFSNLKKIISENSYNKIKTQWNMLSR